MLFKKSFSNVEYSDIEDLKKNQIMESEILDYKDMRIDEKNLVKEVAAFSNTSGGFLIYGIKETGEGGYPESINGIDDNVNQESLEQKILDSVRPRISVQFRKINIPQSNKIIVIIRIPEGQNQPYYNSVTNRYYKRYNFQAKPMDEHEIEALYQKRFFGVAKLAKYIDETILFKRSKLQGEASKKTDGHIIITPLRIDDRIIDTSNKEQIDFDPNKIRLEPRPNELYLDGISKPSRYGVQWSNQNRDQSVEIHRNGLVHYMKNYGDFEEDSGRIIIYDYMLACNLLETIQFADIVYSKFDFIGKVRIVLKVMNSAKSEYMKGRHLLSSRSSHKCDAEEIYVERELDSWRLKEDYLIIGKNIMDEFSNYYGLWKSDMFEEENGVIKFSTEN